MYLDSPDNRHRKAFDTCLQFCFAMPWNALRIQGLLCYRSQVIASSLLDMLQHHVHVQGMDKEKEASGGESFSPSGN